MTTWGGDLKQAFDRLAKMPDEHARGPQFEALIQRLFERSRFHVRRDAGAARPRQTDLFATRGETELLIEVKWRKDRSDIADIDSLRRRLDRTAGHVVGVFFSMGGFTAEAVKEVQEHRDRLTLLFGRDEIEWLFQGRLNLRALLRRKRQRLVSDGQVLFAPDGAPWTGELRPDRTLLPEPDSQLWSPLEGRIPWVWSAGEFGALVFTQELPDVNWTVAQGVGVGLDLHLPLNTEKEVDCLFEALRRVGWLSSSGCFSIHQSGAYWYGTGATGLLDALAAREQRYAPLQGHLHHSEEVVYFDLCDGGFYTLCLYIRATPAGEVRSAHLSAQLPGIPIDVAPLRDLTRYLDCEDQAYLRPLKESLIEGELHLRGKRIKLQPLAFLLSGGGDWVRGIAVKNPFFTVFPSDPPPAPLGSRFPASIYKQEMLVCRLDSWHEVGDIVDYYYLRGFQAAHTGGATVVELSADWNDLLERIHPRKEPQGPARAGAPSDDGVYTVDFGI